MQDGPRQSYSLLYSFGQLFDDCCLIFDQIYFFKLRSIAWINN